MTASAVAPRPGETRPYRFVVTRAKGAQYDTDGLREEFVYRDLGVTDATGGHNGLYRHVVEFQFTLVLEGWVSVYYESHGEIVYRKGDAVTISGNTVHEQRDYSEDLELLEITRPAIYDSVKKDGTRMATPGQKQRIGERVAGTE